MLSSNQKHQQQCQLLLLLYLLLNLFMGFGFWNKYMRMLMLVRKLKEELELQLLFERLLYCFCWKISLIFFSFVVDRFCSLRCVIENLSLFKLIFLGKLWTQLQGNWVMKCKI